MARAFFKEDEIPDEGPALPQRPATPLPITAEGHRRLREERRAIDPSDEATKTRALVLDRILATVFVREASLIQGGAGFGCEVDVRDARGVMRTYRLVGPDEVDPRSGAISEASPLGEALVGRRAGDVVEVERGGRIDDLTVVAVRLPA